MPTSTMFSHRISRAVEAMTIRYQSADPEAREDIEVAASMGPGDRASLGDYPSRGLAAGILTLDEANTLHAIASSWSTSTTPERVVWIQTMFELAKAGV